MAQAREVREAAETIEAELEAAVEAWQDGDLDGVCAALDAAARLEREHGDSPASDELREQLVEEANVVR